MPDRMRGPVLTVVLAATVAAIAVRDQSFAVDPAPLRPDAKNPDLSDRVAELIGRLDAPTLAARTAAEKSLLELGPNVLPHLPPPDLLPNVSVREAVRRVQVALERRRTEESIRPSLVTLEGERPLGDALRAIAMQTGNAIDITSIPETLARKPVAVDFREMPFWSVIDELSDRGGLRIAAPADATKLRLVPATSPEVEPEIVVARAGAFRIGIESAELRPLVGNEADRLLRVKAHVATEPRLRPLFLRYAAKNIRTRVPGGPAFEPFTAEAKYEASFADGGRRIGLRWDFRVPAEALRQPLKTVAIEGALSLLTAAGTETFSFGELEAARGVSRRRGGVTVTLQKVAFRPADGDRTAATQIAVAYDIGGPAFESHRTWMFHNLAYLEDPQGRRIDRDAGYSTELQTDGAVVVGYTFSGVKGSPRDYRFVYLAPTLLIDVPVEFSAADVAVQATQSEK